MGRLIQSSTASDTEEYVYDGARRIQTIRNPGATEETTYYVYGPDYVDELVCQYYRSGLSEPLNPPTYYLQDDSYNVIGLAKINGSGNAEIVRQYVHSPYGEVLISESFGASPPDNAVGHQGLFAYTISSGGDPLGGSAGPILYYNRARWYNPQHGRFMQADPRDTSFIMPKELGFYGATPMLGVMVATGDGQYEFGMSLYEYLGSSPFSWLDPDGLRKRKWGYGLSLATAWEVGFITGVLMIQSQYNFPKYKYQVVKTYADYLVGISTGALWADAGSVLTTRGYGVLAPIAATFGVTIGATYTMLWVIDTGKF